MRSAGVRFALVRFTLAALLAAFLSVTRSAAEELSALGGATDTDDHTAASYAWALEYRERLGDTLDASVGYLNEGHLPGHHRDGVMLELWGRTPAWWHQRVSLAFGAGPYAFFDTLTDPGSAAGYRDVHGVGAVASVALRYALSDRWFALLELNQVVGWGDASTRSVLLGAGWRLDRVLEGLSRGASGGAPDPAALNEIGLCFGETVINGLNSDASNAFGAEYRRRMARYLELSVSVLSDSDGVDGRHQAATGEAWLVQEFFASRLVVGAGLGAYAALQSYRTVDGRGAASVEGLGSLTVAWRFARRFDARLVWHRGFTGDDQDRDVVTAGVGWRF
jgi:hypothetical protein